MSTTVCRILQFCNSECEWVFHTPRFLVCLIFALLTGLRWNLNSAQICISQMTSAKGRFIKHFWAIFSLSLFILRPILNVVYVFLTLYFQFFMFCECHLSVVKLAKIPTHSVYHLFTQLFPYLCKCFSVFWRPMIQLLKLFTAMVSLCLIFRINIGRGAHLHDVTFLKCHHYFCEY